MDVARLVKFGLALLLVAAAFPFAARGLTALWGAPRIYSVEDAPERRVAVIFGARIYGSGRPSAMLADRIRAGVALYQAGKVDVLLMTGDHSAPEYNEPGVMRNYALSLGMPADAIVLDYAGRRTYDSCYRARHIFGVTDAVLVTQNFHLPRALLTCSALGIDAVGVRADDQRPTSYSIYSLRYSRIREIPATAVAVLDILRREEPPVMGEPLPIFPVD
jgi:SanA protein